MNIALHTLNITPKWFNKLKRKHDQYRQYRDTVNQLSRLSNRELKDIGIDRGMIRGIAATVYEE